MIETVVRYLDSLATDAGDDPGLKLEIAKAYRRIGALEGHPLHANLGQTAAARTHYAKALELLETLPQTSTNAIAVEETVRVNAEIGDIEIAAGNLEKAKSYFRSAAAPIGSTVLSPNTEVYIYFRLGDIEAQQGSPGTALPHFRNALDRAEAWAATSDDIVARRELQRAYRRVANAARESGDLVSSRDNLFKAKQVIEECLRRSDRNGEDQRELWTILVILADVLGGPDELNFGDYNAALAHYRSGAALAEQMVAADKHDMRARRDLGVSYRRLGLLLVETAPSEALAYYLKSLEIAEDLHAMDSASVDFRRDVAESNLGLGILARQSGRHSEALDRLNRALDLQNSIETTAPNRVWVARYITQIHKEIGNVLMSIGDSDGALKSYHQALAAAERLLQRAPTVLHLERDRLDVLEATGHYYLTLSGRSDTAVARRDRLQAQARTYFQQSLATWQRWIEHKLARPYADHRLSKASTDLALARLPQTAAEVGSRR
jgi:tetratricopeptide (TPR) repeat protein